jgi:Putative beta-barrel porin-2, OmpL-like. bbp2
MRFSRGLSLMGLLAIGGVANAADAPADAKPTGPSLADVLTASGLTVSGYVDAMYDYSDSPTPLLQEFTGHHSSFLLNQASVTVAYQPKEGFGALAQVIAGEDGRILNETANPASDSPFDITQAFVQYASGQWTLQGGKMLTLVGAEVIAPTGNSNVSRSLLFFGEPLTHTGFRATFAANDTLNLIFGVNNGWNATSDANVQKTAEVGLGWTPSKAFALTVQGYFGNETGGISGFQWDGTRSIVDAVATWNVNDSLTLILSADYGEQKNFTLGTSTVDAKWNGVAGYFNYAINSAWRVSVRAEYLRDQDGFISGVDQNIKEATVTFGYAPSKNFELRLEGRIDKAADDYFIKDNTGGLGDTQSHVLIEGVYKFPAPTS